MPFTYDPPNDNFLESVMDTAPALRLQVSVKELEKATQPEPPEIQGTTARIGGAATKPC